jgi:hypothetical protein
MELRRELSSKASFIHRILVPIALVGGVTLMLWRFASFSEDGSSVAASTIFAMVIYSTMIALAWYLSRAKRVWLEGDELVVADFSEETRYSLKSIDQVTATRFWSPEQVRILFRLPGGVDKTIFFFPPIRWFTFFSQHPIAEEIRQLAHASASPSTPYTKQSPPTDWRRVILAVAGIAIFAFVILGLAMAMMKESEPYKWSLAQVRSNSSVSGRLGSPIEPDWFVTGSIRKRADTGSAFLRYSVSGPNGNGTVSVAGKMAGGSWTYSRGEIEIEGEHLSFVGR